MFTLDSLRTDRFSWKAALSLATASKLSYESEVAVQNLVRNSWGFTDCEFLDIGDTQGFVAQTSDVALVVFRGTESLRDWLRNLRLLSTQQPYGAVHLGFFEGFRLVRAKVVQALSRGGGGARRVWLTGHSLGGALAAIAAAELKDNVRFTGIHTCGQPRVGNDAFKRFMREQFAGNYSRFVNDEDLVTKVPPHFEHVGTLIHFDAHGNVERPTLEAEAEALEPPALTEEEFRQLQEEIRQIEAQSALRGLPEQEAVLDASVEGLIPGLSDHSIDRYIAIIRRQAEAPRHDAAVRVELEVRGGFESIETAGAPAPKRTTDPLPVLLRIKDPAWKAPSGVKVNSRFGTIVSAQVSAEQLANLERDPGVASIEASRDAGMLELATSLPFVGADKVHRPPIQEKGDAALVGILDTGVDVLHEAFRDQQGKTRILAYWDQKDPNGPTPKTVDGSFTQDYGTLYLADEIDRFIAGTRQTPRPLRDPFAHGTHVASIAAGRAVGSVADGMAPEAGIIVVATHREKTTSPNDPPSLGYSVSHVDALAFLKTAAGGGTKVLAQERPIAVNVSQGMNAGAHDGSSALEAAFDSITNGGRDPGYVIVKSAGNERGLGGHARVRAFNGLVKIEWDATAGSISRLQDYIEVWYSFLDELQFTLVDPAGNRSGTVSRATPDITQVLNENSCHLRLTEYHPDNGDHRLLITIAPRLSSIQTGRWTLEVLGTNIQSSDGLVDAWVERDARREVRFVGDEPRTTLSIPGTARTVIAVGACNSTSPLQITSFSSFGLSRDGQPKPDICAPGLDITAASAGQQQGARTNSGTSMAAPHVAGALALVLSRRSKQPGKPQYNAQQLRAGLIRNAGHFTRVHHEGFGYGVLDAAALIANMP